MKIRRRDLFMALVIAAWLGLFCFSCTQHTPPPDAKPRPEAGSSDDRILLEKPDSDFETQADHSEMVP